MLTEHDLRLVPAALGAWLAAFAGLRTGMVITLTTAAIALLVVLLLLRRPEGWRAVGSAALIGIAIGSAATGARLVTRDDPVIAGLIRDRATVEVVLTVRDDPHRTRSRTPTWAISAELESGARVLVLASDPQWTSVLPGQRVRASGRFAAPLGGDLRAAVVSVTGPPDLLGKPPWAQRAAGGLRAGLRAACAGLDPRPGGLLPGLVVGDISALPPEVAQDFVDTGMTHLTAVSGSNVAIIVSALLLAARWCRVGPRLTAAICVVGIAGFVILARPSPSVLRAAVMGGIALLALATGRRRAALPALCATITVLVAIDPELAASAGFALSVCATGGLLLLAPVWRDALCRRGWPAPIAEAVSIPAAAQVACGPVIAAISGSVSVIAVPANLLAAVAIAPATVLGVAAAILSTVWPGGAAFAAWLASWPCQWLVLVAHTGAGVPAGLLPWPAGTPGALLLAAVTVLVLLGGRHRVVRRIGVVVVLAGVVGAVPIRVLAPGWPPTGWVAVACDVGQGDAIVLRAAEHTAVVIDAGPEPGAVDGCLDRLGITDVPLLVISHFHADHTGGVAGVFQGRRVVAVLVPAWPEPAAGRRAVEQAAATHGITPAQALPGTVLSTGHVRLRVIGPVSAVRGSRSDPNNNSVVLEAIVTGVRIVLAGDAEVEEQGQLVGSVGRADVLKAAHHGSAFQSPELLDEIAPRIALVSVGAGNDYGHPNAAVLQRLERAGARVMRTDLQGDIAVVLEPDGGLAVVAH